MGGTARDYQLNDYHPGIISPICAFPEPGWGARVDGEQPAVWGRPRGVEGRGERGTLGISPRLGGPERWMEGTFGQGCEAGSVDRAVGRVASQKRAWCRGEEQEERAGAGQAPHCLCCGSRGGGGRAWDASVLQGLALLGG